MIVAVLGLFGVMLVLMLMRVALPIGSRVEGKTLAQYPLSFRERLTLQRTNVYLIGAVLLLGSFAGWLPMILELVVVVGVFAILTIPVRYTFTAEGIALNHVVFRSWSEFQAAQASRGRILLLGKPGMKSFSMLRSSDRQSEPLRLVQQLIDGDKAGPPRKRAMKQTRHEMRKEMRLPKTAAP